MWSGANLMSSSEMSFFTYYTQMMIGWFRHVTQHTMYKHSYQKYELNKQEFGYVDIGLDSKKQ